MDTPRILLIGNRLDQEPGGFLVIGHNILQEDALQLFTGVPGEFLKLPERMIEELAQKLTGFARLDNFREHRPKAFWPAFGGVVTARCRFQAGEQRLLPQSSILRVGDAGFLRHNIRVECPR